MIWDAGTERGTAEETTGAMTEKVGVVEPAMEPAWKANEASGGPGTAQTVGMTDGKGIDPPGSEDGDAEVAEWVELAPAGLEELRELDKSKNGVNDEQGANNTTNKVPAAGARRLVRGQPGMSAGLSK